MIKADAGNMGAPPEGRPGGTGADFGQPGSAVHPEYEARPVEELAPGVAVPNKPFEIREAIMKKPSNYDSARKVMNPYPAVCAVLANLEGTTFNLGDAKFKIVEKAQGDQYLIKCISGTHKGLSAGDTRNLSTDVLKKILFDQKAAHAGKEQEMKQKPKYPAVQAALSPYPTVDAAMDEAGVAEDNDHLEKLGIEAPEEFGIKFKGQLDVLAEEHDLGDLMAYALTDYGIIIFGTENVLKLDYALENPDIKPVYYFEQGEEVVEPSSEEVTIDEPVAPEIEPETEEV